MKFERKLIQFWFLSLTIAGCARKVAERPVSIWYSPSPPVLTEKVYYAKPKQVEVTRLSKIAAFQKTDDTFKRIPPRRKTLFWLSSDSINPERFKDFEVKAKINKAKKLLQNEEKLQEEGKRKNPRSIGLYSLLTLVAGIATISVFINYGLGAYLGVLLIILAVLGFIIYIVESLLRKIKRWQAVHLINRAPSKSSYHYSMISNKLESLDILKFYMPAHRLKRKLNKLRPEIEKSGTQEQVLTLKRLEQLALNRSRTEKGRMFWHYVKVILLLIIAFIFIALLLWGSGGGLQMGGFAG